MRFFFGSATVLHLALAPANRILRMHIKCSFLLFKKKKKSNNISLGRPIAVSVYFTCVIRRLVEINKSDLHETFRSSRRLRLLYLTWRFFLLLFSILIL